MFAVLFTPCHCLGESSVGCLVQHHRAAITDYSAVKKYLTPSDFVVLLHICHTYRFEIIKLILILDGR